MIVKRYCLCFVFVVWISPPAVCPPWEPVQSTRVLVKLCWAMDSCCWSQ